MDSSSFLESQENERLIIRRMEVIFPHCAPGTGRIRGEAAGAPVHKILSGSKARLLLLNGYPSYEMSMSIITLNNLKCKFFFFCLKIHSF